MRRTLSAFLFTAALGPGCVQLCAQTHKVARPEQVVRAVGVYEWTGDLKKPSASRLIPITVFIDGALEDAGVYLPRPIPFALTPGNEYELQQAGVSRGTLDLAYARHLQTTDLAFEDGWFGYGSYKAVPAAAKEHVLRASRNPAVLTSSKDDSRPHLTSKTDTPASDKQDPGDKTPPASDPTDTSSKKTSGSAPADDPDRPTMRRRSGSSAPAAETPDVGTSSVPADDPDRPTLRRRSSDDSKKGKPAADVAHVTGTGSLNDDPDRPKLQRGARSSANDTDMPKLVGVPKDLQQMVAVSDATNRTPHDFTRPWQDPQERTDILTKMRALAQAQLLAYASSPSSSQGTVARPAAPAARSATQRRATSRTAAKVATAPEVPLLEEELKGYTLSYGGAPTYIYTAHTAGTGADLRYVTVVAQADVAGDLRPAIKSVTDEAHLDRAPRMRFVDVADVEASNRASLVVELRSQTSRQFALYRVIGSRAEAFFTTGTTQ